MIRIRLKAYVGIKDLKEDNFTDSNVKMLVTEEEDNLFHLLPNGANIKIDMGFGDLTVAKEIFFNEQKELDRLLKEENIDYLFKKINDVGKALPKAEMSKFKAGIRLLAKDFLE